MNITDAILDKCKGAGAGMADVFNLSTKTLAISVRDGQVESIKKATPGGLAIRFYRNDKLAFGHTTLFDGSRIESMIPQLESLSQKSAAEEFAVLPSPQKYQADLDIFDKSQIEQSMEAKIEYLKNLETLAMKFDPLISKSEGVGYEEYEVTRSLSNTNGISVSFNATFYRVGIFVVASKNGEMYPGEGSLWACHFSDLPAPEKIAEIFASKAARLVGGTPVDGGDYQIIFTPRAANSILWGLSGALNGDEAFKGSSFLAGKAGSKIAVEGLSLYDNALKPRGIGSRPFDDEGTASVNTALIENGVLKNYLYDSSTAAKAKSRSTASARREDYSSYPSISATNFYIAPGKDKLADVVASCKKGIIVEDTAGWGLHNVTGQYSAGINGILVENGKKIRAIAGVTIAASADEILNGIGAICNDITYYDNFSSPSLMVKRMTVGA